MEPKRCLIIGGAGFAGAALAHALLERGDQVTVCDVVSPLGAQRLSGVMQHPDFTYLWKAVHDLTSKDLYGYNVIFHLAGQTDVPLAYSSPRWTIHQNVEGTVALLEACRSSNPEKLVYVGSGWDYRTLMGLGSRETESVTHNPYAFSKAAAEMACWTYYKAFGLPLVITNVGSNGVIIGPQMRRDVFLFRWLWNIALGRPIVLEGGRQRRSLVYVDDVVRAWLLILDAPPESVKGAKLNIGCQPPLLLTEILKKCFSITKKVVEVEKCGYRAGESEDPKIRQENGKRLPNYEPAIGPEEAIRRTWIWVSEQAEHR